MDFRRSPRVPADLKITTYHKGRVAMNAQVTNISIQGLFLKAASTFPKGTLLEIRFSLAINNITEIIHVCTEVTHAARDGMGVKFSEDGSNALFHLRKILKKQFFQPHLNTSVE